MKKYEKEILQAQIDNEKAVLKKLEQNYEDTLAEINDKIAILLGRADSDQQHVVYQVEFQKNLKKQVEVILETLHSNEFETISEYLTKSYDEGFLGAMYSMQKQGIPLIFPIDQEQVVAAIQNETKLSESLYTSLGKDIKTLNKQIASEISRGISNGAMYADIARNIASFSRIPQNRAMTIARTESHRIQETATYNAHKKAESKGADIVKIWSAALDGSTRDTHRELDGQIRELDEPFEVGGKKAMYPGGFGDPAEDCNCRCRCNSKARWLIDAPYTKWSADAPILVSDEGTTQYVQVSAKNYEDFKKQYKEAAERVREGAQKITAEGTKALNKNGEEITFDFDSMFDSSKRFYNPERAKARANDIQEKITILSDQYNTYLTSVKTGTSIKTESGTKAYVEVDGKMYLVDTRAATFFHEFAHSLTSGARIKTGLADINEIEFDKELTKLFSEYKEAVYGNPKKGIKGDIKKSISGYSFENKYEFMAEAFAHSKMKEFGYDLSKVVEFGDDFTYSYKLVDLTDKYFKKEQLEKIGKSSTMNIVKESIESGKVSKEININKQNRHIKESSGYIEGRSYINGNLEDAQRMVDELSGTGEPVYKSNGEWANKEKVSSNKTVGINVNPTTKEETETKNATIHYSKTGSHIVPRKGE